MSEYQLYEFEAVDRPLTSAQMAELRTLSARASISRVRFRSEYDRGDLDADPAKLLTRYFDAHLYFGGWGTRRLMLRIPKERIDHETLRAYMVRSGRVHLRSAGRYLILDLMSETEAFESELGDDNALSALTELRAELLRGDWRAAYLAWLIAVEGDDVDDAALEPPVPAGLKKLTTAQQTMVDFLRIDGRLVKAAARNSPALPEDDKRFRTWVKRLSPVQKDAWLRRAVEEPTLALGGELLREFRATTHACSAGTRTAGELREIAAR